MAAHEIVVVNSRFCSQESVSLTFGRKSDHLAVTDDRGNVIFKVKEGIEDRQLVVIEGSTNISVLISMKAKVCTLHHRWRVFTGDSSRPECLLFTVKKSSMIQQHKTELCVFLAANTEEKVADFKIKGNFEKKTCTVCKGESSMVVAQMTRDYQNTESSASSEEVFGVTVNRRVDAAFITALVAILCEIKRREKIVKKVATVAGSAALTVINIGLDVADIIMNA